MRLFEQYINKLPESIVNALKDTPQDPKWHPEGNVYNHIEIVFNSVVTDYPDNEVMLLSAIFHDLGKIDNTKTIVKHGKNKIVAYGHEFKSLDYIDKYFHLFSDSTSLKEAVKDVVKNHMKTHLYNSGALKTPSKREAFEKKSTFNTLIDFAKCDDMGKNVINVCFDRFDTILYEGDVVSVQNAGEHTIYKKEDGCLYFKPYGKEERVKDYFMNDIIKINK